MGVLLRMNPAIVDNLAGWKISARLTPVALAALFAGFSLALRIASFGHPNIDSDEAFYFLVGQAMHEGAIPYVDLWDRKPFGLFALYYLFAGISSSVLAYQIPAWLSVAATSWLINGIATRLHSRRAGISAGLIYPLMLPLLFGWGGQAPVFYNLPVAGAAYLMVRALPKLHGAQVPRAAHVAMATLGIAITIKQTVLFEAAYFGLAGVCLLARAGCPWLRTASIAAVWIALGLGPTAAVAIAYWSIGHWPEFWQATVTSNFAKRGADAITLLARARDLYFRLAPLAGAALLGVLLTRTGRPRDGQLQFFFGWIVAAAVGFVAVPNLYPHYALPLLPPLAVAAGMFFARGWIGALGLAAVVAYSAWNIEYFDWRYTRTAQQQVTAMARSVREHGGSRGLFIFDGPILLYRLVGQRPLSPLALPLHLNYAVEENVSHLNTNAEVARVLSLNPGAVTVPLYSRNNPRNEQAFDMVLGYVHQHCRLVDLQNSSEMFRTDPIAVYGDCQ
jgi:hypothetical protein